MKKILIIGSTGFIGSNLLKRLKEKKLLIKTYNLSEGKDILNEKQLEKEVRKKYDVIYNLSGFSGSTEGNKNIRKSFLTNTLATISLMQLIVKYSPETLLILSGSRLEYGRPNYLPVDENHPLNPNSIYGMSKMISTQLAIFFHNHYGLKVSIFRTSNVYGPHKDKKFKGYNLINHFFDLAKEDKELSIFGSGNQLRDYIYIDDLVDVLIKSADAKKFGQIYNIGLGKGIKIRKMLELIINNVGKGRIKQKPWPRDYFEVETGNYVTNISKATNDLKFKPITYFKEGIEKMIKNSK